MPAEYEKMRDGMIRSGMDEKKAKRIAAIHYWKKHHVAVNKAHKGGK